MDLTRVFSPLYVCGFDYSCLPSVACISGCEADLAAPAPSARGASVNVPSPRRDLLPGEPGFVRADDTPCPGEVEPLKALLQCWLSELFPDCENDTEKLRFQLLKNKK